MLRTPWNINYHWWQKDGCKRDKLNTPLVRRDYGTEVVNIKEGDKVRVYFLGSLGYLCKPYIKEGVMISHDRVKLDGGRQIKIGSVYRIDKLEEVLYQSGYGNI